MYHAEGERGRGGEAFHEGLQRHARAPAGRSGGRCLGQAEQTRTDLDAPIALSEVKEVLRVMKPGKATSNMVPGELLMALDASSVALGQFHRLVSDIFEDERNAPWTTGHSAEPPPADPQPSEVPPEPPPPAEIPPEPPPARRRSERRPPPPVTPSVNPAPDGKRSPKELVQGAKDHGWRCQWQAENPKRGESEVRSQLRAVLRGSNILRGYRAGGHARGP